MSRYPFLSVDEPIAAAVYSRLSEQLNESFFYPRTQEALAGTDGLETMRAPFLRENARVVVVFYRDRWVKTPWTGVEEVAIRDRCLKDRFEGLFVMMPDNTSAPPTWLPDTHVRFNYADFGLEQAVGAIKTRVKERGGTIMPLTPLRRVELYQQEQEYLEDKRQLFRSHDARSSVTKHHCCSTESKRSVTRSTLQMIWGLSSSRRGTEQAVTSGITGLV